jgi:hypothetical protein
MLKPIFIEFGKWISNVPKSTLQNLHLQDSKHADKNWRGRERERKTKWREGKEWEEKRGEGREGKEEERERKERRTQINNTYTYQSTEHLKIHKHWINLISHLDL